MNFNTIFVTLALAAGSMALPATETAQAAQAAQAGQATQAGATAANSKFWIGGGARWGSPYGYYPYGYGYGGYPGYGWW